jgi:hypothetical protein
MKELQEAFAKAQAAFKPLKKNKKNPFFNSSFADLDSINDSTKEALTSNGLSISSNATTNGQIVTVETVIMHSSGQSLRVSAISAKAKDETPQSIGGAVTYLRRYSLQAALNISADEDDDGNSNQKETYKEEKLQKVKVAAIMKKIGVPSEHMAEMSRNLIDTPMDEVEAVIKKVWEKAREASK